MTFDIEKMLREGATPEDISKKVTAELNAAQRKLNAEAAKNAEKRSRCAAKAKIAADALNDFLREEGVCGPKEEVFTANDLINSVKASTDMSSLLEQLFGNIF